MTRSLAVVIVLALAACTSKPMNPGPVAHRTHARTGATFSHVFNTEGTFSYRCTVHFGMTGVVRVR